jgi:hypothetical protein
VETGKTLRFSPNTTQVAEAQAALLGELDELSQAIKAALDLR